MINKDQVLKKVDSIEDKLLISKVIDKALKAEREYTVTYTNFLDPRQKALIKKHLIGELDVKSEFNGGYSGAEREVAIFAPEFLSLDDESFYSDILKAVSVKTAGDSGLTHRDFLGSLMGLGIKREKIGDIIVNEDTCKIVVLNEIAEYIALNLDKVGKVKVKAEITDISNVSTPNAKFKEINTTVASLRLDAITSAGFGISRTKALDYIKGEKVSINWETVSSPAKEVKEGDIISFKGKGRAVLEKIGSETKKGRITVTLKKYI